ncbi:hypothetical protein A2617_03650 [Candidatus Daviesbacteria bacterium RIFOXYD1_FULL_41_10]|uniref:Plasmid stabilization protein n=1 Tax=Candidatus Daviesbacteria bacterium RIFOXYD1_FULL_41_10 TaxID=1797801 RepID=A0A1F5N0Y7_9BACT|nr:MAG: hypothetical protein A2617_03650 [Candidatus Daviesbacteria bacterium RIFOXYD1_FULL_41_10]
MRYTFSTEVQRQLKEINKKDRKLSKKIYKQLSLFLDNPKYPSLKIHKLSGKMKNQYSISVTQGFRMTYTLLGDGAHFTKIGTHDEVYKNN